MKVFKGDIVECIKDLLDIKKGEVIVCDRDNFLKDIDITMLEREYLDFDKYFIKLKETFYEIKIGNEWSDPHRLIDKRVRNHTLDSGCKRSVLLLRDNTYVLLSLEQFEEMCRPYSII